MAAAPGFLSAEKFEQVYGDGKPHYEYWFGEAIQKHMPTLLHSILQGLLFALIRQRGWHAATELRLKISKLAYPVPDVAASSSQLEGPYPTRGVELCVEILSPGDSLKALFAKGAHYLDWGVGTVWILEGEQQRAFRMSLDKPEPEPISLVGSLTAGTEEGALSISMRELFDELNKELRD